MSTLLPPALVPFAKCLSYNPSRLPICSGLALVIRRHHPCHAPHFALASTPTCPSSCSVIPGGGVRSIPYPEMLSWLDRSQSQEAVIEAVGGG
jgi:hypothetical protein